MNSFGKTAWAQIALLIVTTAVIGVAGLAAIDFATRGVIA